MAVASARRSHLEFGMDRSAWCHTYISTILEGQGVLDDGDDVLHDVGDDVLHDDGDDVQHFCKWLGLHYLKCRNFLPSWLIKL